MLKVIDYDLLRNDKVLHLLLVILVFAIFVVATVYHTHLPIAWRDQLVVSSHALDIEWRHLILEENALGNYSRIEHIAIKELQMQHVDKKENVIIRQ